MTAQRVTLFILSVIIRKFETVRLSNLHSHMKVLLLSPKPSLQGPSHFPPPCFAQPVVALQVGSHALKQFKAFENASRSSFLKLNYNMCNKNYILISKKLLLNNSRLD